MNAKRFYYVMLGLCFAMIAAIAGGVYVGDKLLARQAKQIATARADDELVDQKRRIKKDLEKKVRNLSDVNKLAETFLPDSKNQDLLIAEFNQIAKENNISIDGISFEAIAASGAATTTTLSQTQALKDVKNVLVLPFSIKAKPVSFDRLIGFLKAIENNRRKMQVTNISITPINDPKDPDYGKLGITEFKLEVYIKGNGTPTSSSATGQTAPPPSR